MRENEALNGGFLSHPSAVSRVHVVRPRTIGRERAIQDRGIDAVAKMEKGFAVLGVSRVRQCTTMMLDPIADAVESRSMLDGFRPDSGLSDLKRLVGNLPDRYAEGRCIKRGERAQHRVDDPFRPAWAEDGQVGPFADMAGVERGIEKESDEIREVVGVKMGEEDITDLMPINTGLHEIVQRAWAEIEQEHLVGLDQIACRRPFGMHIGTGTQNGQLHGTDLPPSAPGSTRVDGRGAENGTASSLRLPFQGVAR